MSLRIVIIDHPLPLTSAEKDAVDQGALVAVPGPSGHPPEWRRVYRSDGRFVALVPCIQDLHRIREAARRLGEPPVARLKAVDLGTLLA